MKVYIYFFFLVSFAFAGPAKQLRRYFPEENDPNHRRYIYVENSEGGYDLIDLAKPEKTILEAKLSDVTYYLYTKNHFNIPYKITNGDIHDLALSPFNPKNPVIFISHGWNNNVNSTINSLIREAISEVQLDVNLFVVDWSRPANSNYLTAKNAVVPVGAFVGNFINQIQAMYKLDGHSFLLIGHSLGAHVIGNAGAIVNKKVGHIIGLDPAAPLFTIRNTENRLDSSDGNFVQIIHTNGALLGFASSIGHADYYPNGGMSQPGCGWDLAGTCAHGRSYRYLAESIKRGPVFLSVLCSDYNKYQKGLCNTNIKSTMGYVTDTKAEGDFYLETNENEPFAKN